MKTNNLLNHTLEITNYHDATNKIKDDLRIVVLSDFHGSTFGSKNHDLIQKVNELKPDCILLPGDVFDEWCDVDKTFEVLKAFKQYPMFYSTGNHEERMDGYLELLKRMRSMGIEVLHKRSVLFECKNTVLEIGGISSRVAEYDYQPEEVNAIFKTDHYRILLSHRPHWINLYRQIKCNMIVCGHAHGGQWRLPNGHRGLIAPQQGFFPRYTEGLLQCGFGKLLIGRGLAKTYHGIPRLFNPPEIVVLHLHP